MQDNRQKILMTPQKMVSIARQTKEEESDMTGTENEMIDESHDSKVFIKLAKKNDSDKKNIKNGKGNPEEDFLQHINSSQSRADV